VIATILNSITGRQILMLKQ